MQLWFSRTSAVTLREQLVAQIILGILSGDLAPGQRLPSTRELARRFRLHPNTVSAGYRQLKQERWVEFRHGSGVYVRKVESCSATAPSIALDRMIANVFASARTLNIPLATVRSRLTHWLELQPPDHFLLVEPDENLRRILAAEIEGAVSLPVMSCALEDAAFQELADGAIPITPPSKEKIVRDALPQGAELLVLQVRSVPSSLAGWLPAPSGALVAIASGWPGFLKMARTILIAAGFQTDGLLFRDTRKANWQRGLQEAAAVVCDSVTVASLPKTARSVVFPLISETSLAELRRYEAFIRNPLAGSAS